MQARTRTLALVAPLAAAGIFIAAQSFGAEWSDPFRTAPNAPHTPVPLRPPEQPTPQPDRAPAVVKPAFGWRTGDRVVLLGDGLLAREARLGFFECRFMAQQPGHEFQVRNLHWLTNHPLARLRGGVDPDWPALIRAELAPLEPTVIVLAFGNDLALNGPEAVPSFRTNLELLIEALAGDGAGTGPRLLLFSPVGRVEPPEVGAEVVQTLDLRRTLAGSVRAVAADRNAEYVDLFSWVQPTAEFLKRRGETNAEPFPPLFDQQEELTAYGYSRAVLALEASLRWSPPTWRFGYGLDGRLRAGSFGTVHLERNRGRTWMRVRQIEQILPWPHPEGFVDRDSETRPQCYIQLTSLDPGLYALRVDDEEILRAAESEWARGQVIADGPSWRQAEELRQSILEKNELVARRWGPGGVARPPVDQESEMTMFNDPVIAEIERKIFEIRKPVPRVYEVIRVGENRTQP